MSDRMEHAAVTAVDTSSTSRKKTGTVFEPGDLVANRYLIERFIAEGGMGEVYAARDTELAEQLALKTIRGEYASRPVLLAKFKREIHVARQVTHPNVCRVYDLGQHQGTFFLTMQLLPGESLAHLILREQRLSPEQALPIAKQIAAGMDAAHREGVVHRDLKPGNVMLLPEDNGTTRAVLTDFGLARRDNDDPQHDLTRTGEVAGSPAYMAPEQVVEDSEVGPPADIYAFGIILFEMITGVRPFDGASTISTASRRLIEAAPSPRKWVPDLDRRWERTILRCLSLDPARRPKTGADIVAMLASKPTRAKSPKLFAAAAVGAVLVGGGIGVAVVSTLSSSKSSSSALSSAGKQVAPAGRRAVAVIGFRNLAARPDTAWISPALAELFATELGSELRTLPGQDVARARIELGLAEAGVLDAQTLARVRTALAADVVLTGSYFAAGTDTKVRLDIYVQDAKQGSTLATISEQGDSSELPDVVVRASAKVRDALGIAPPTAAGQTRSSLPANREAARLYAEGIDQLNRLEVVQARDSLEQASRLEPAHPVIRAALAEAWAELGYDTKAKEQAKLALSHADQLPASERSQVEARYHLAAKEWDAAIRAYEAVAKAAPDDLDAALALARAQIAAQRAKHALATLARLQGVGLTDPRIDLEAARAHKLLSELPAQRDAAARAIARAEQIGATILAARARVEHAGALLALGEHAPALQSLDEAERAFKQARETRGLAAVMHTRALIAYREGKLDQGDELEIKAANFFRETGSTQSLARALMNLGVFASKRGNAKLAISRFNEAIEVARAADDRWVLALALSGLADTERLGGSLADAAKHEAEALDHARATQSKRAEGYIVQTLGQIALARADLAEAEQRAKESVPLAEALGDPTLVALAAVELGRIRFEANDLLSAREHAERSRSAHETIKEAHNAAVAQTVLAEIELAEGNATDAIAHATRVRPALADTPTDLAYAEAVLLRAQLAAGKLADAKATATRIEPTMKQSYPDGRIRARLALAALEVRDGSTTRARQLIEAARAEADNHGLALSALYCELAAAQLERSPAGAKRLAALAEQATSRGLMRLAALATPPAK